MAHNQGVELRKAGSIAGKSLRNGQFQEYKVRAARVAVHSALVYRVLVGQTSRSAIRSSDRISERSSRG